MNRQRRQTATSFVRGAAALPVLAGTMFLGLAGGGLLALLWLG